MLRHLKIFFSGDEWGNFQLFPRSRIKAQLQQQKISRSSLWQQQKTRYQHFLYVFNIFSFFLILLHVFAFKQKFNVAASRVLSYPKLFFFPQWEWKKEKLKGVKTDENFPPSIVFHRNTIKKLIVWKMFQKRSLPFFSAYTHTISTGILSTGKNINLIANRDATTQLFFLLF